ncbi:hypothetical protein CGRA01v4_11810 [Colletotrichum graminicola]|nr:hypothetical protein CGRA01v4_11810 [Colletotrichum graminicola]
MVRLSPVPSFTVHPITDPRLFKRTTPLTSFTPNPGSQLADRWRACASGPPNTQDQRESIALVAGNEERAKLPQQQQAWPSKFENHLGLLTLSATPNCAIAA